MIIMTVLEFVITSIVISIGIAGAVGLLVYHMIRKHYDEYEENIDRLKLKVEMLEERTLHMEEEYVEHMAKYH